jgi:hypothetical protein
MRAGSSRWRLVTDGDSFTGYGGLAHDPACLGASLAEFTGHPGYGLGELRGDLERFTFLLGGSDGEHLFGP